MRRAFAAQNAKVGDPDFVQMPLEELLSDTWAARQRTTIAKDRATPSADIASAAASGVGPHTTHVSIVDFGLDSGAVTNAPRSPMQHLPDEVSFEKDGLLPLARWASGGWDTR